MPPQPSEIEVVGLAAEDFLVGFVVLLALVGFAFFGGYLAGVWGQFGRDEPEALAASEDLGAVTTVEIPADSRPRGRTRQPYTGTVHAAHMPAADESSTEVIRRPNGVAS